MNAAGNQDSRDRVSNLIVRLNVDYAPQGMEMLLPGGAPQWGPCSFQLNPAPGGRADFYVVLASARPLDRCTVARSNTLFIAGEPPEKKIYPFKFYKQFAHLVDTHNLSGHSQVHLSAPGLNWHVGLDMNTRTYRYGYDYLAALACPPKENKISVVCSDAAFTPGQKKRLAFLEFLKAKFGDRIVHFGRGFKPIDDKMEAILPYRYHLVLENSRSPNYWTEKVADAYLGWAFPIYLGCPNIFDFFPQNSLTVVDGSDFDADASKLAALLDVPVNDDQYHAIAEARNSILNRYNPFAWSAYWAQQLYRQDAEELTTIISHKAFRPFPMGALFRMRRAVRSKINT